MGTRPLLRSLRDIFQGDAPLSLHDETENDWIHVAGFAFYAAFLTVVALFLFLPLKKPAERATRWLYRKVVRPWKRIRSRADPPELDEEEIADAANEMITESVKISYAYTVNGVFGITLGHRLGLDLGGDLGRCPWPWVVTAISAAGLGRDGGRGVCSTTRASASGATTREGARGSLGGRTGRAWVGRRRRRDGSRLNRVLGHRLGLNLGGDHGRCLDKTLFAKHFETYSIHVRSFYSKIWNSYDGIGILGGLNVYHLIFLLRLAFS